MGLYNKIKRKFIRESKYLYRDFWQLLGLNDRFFNGALGSRIMIYHGICSRDPLRFNPIFLTRRTFENHLKLYKKHFNVVSLNDFYEQKFSNSKFNICLTFDDGFANNHKYVLPLLEQYKIPATFFVTAIRKAGHDILWNDFLTIAIKYGPAALLYKNEAYSKGIYNKYYSHQNGQSLFDQLRLVGFAEKAKMMRDLDHLAGFKKNQIDDDYWMQMTGAQIEELSNSPYATIGSHGVYHNDMANINLTEATAELTESKKYLENITNKLVDSFAFPFGSYNQHVVNETIKAGYNKILAMDFHFEEDYNNTILRERFTVNPLISPPNQLIATINHRYDQ